MRTRRGWRWLSTTCRPPRWAEGAAAELEDGVPSTWRNGVRCRRRCGRQRVGRRQSLLRELRRWQNWLPASVSRRCCTDPFWRTSFVWGWKPGPGSGTFDFTGKGLTFNLACHVSGSFRFNTYFGHPWCAQTFLIRLVEYLLRLHWSFHSCANTIRHNSKLFLCAWNCLFTSLNAFEEANILSWLIADFSYRLLQRKNVNSNSKRWVIDWVFLFFLQKAVPTNQITSYLFHCKTFS